MDQEGQEQLYLDSIKALAKGQEQVRGRGCLGHLICVSLSKHTG